MSDCHLVCTSSLFQGYQIWYFLKSKSILTKFSTEIFHSEHYHIILGLSYWSTWYFLFTLLNDPSWCPALLVAIKPYNEIIEWIHWNPLGATTSSQTQQFGWNIDIFCLKPIISRHLLKFSYIESQSSIWC